MPNDQYGRPISVGDTVMIKGEVVHVLDNPNYVNCTVKLSQSMPPSGAEIKVECNTAQLEYAGVAKPLASGAKMGGEQKSEQHEPPQTQHAQHQPPPAKK